MTDRELLELAAKAAGMKCRWWKVKEWAPTSYASGAMRGRMFKGCKDVFGTHHSKPWSPLTDDGDALRLAVKLKLLLCSEGCMAMHHEYKGNRHTDWFGGHPENEHVGIDHDEFDPFAATRLAIVRAAAEIGKGL